MSTNSRKGKLVEDLAARLMKSKFAKVQTRVFLQPKIGRKREIDILVTFDLPTGQKILYVVECKNESKPIGIEKIDGFVGKLIQLEIPPSQGIFVSRSRFTIDALERAETDGIRTLRITGIGDDGLKELLHLALQSVIWLFATITQFSITCESKECSLHFVNQDGVFVGMVFDLIYRAWLNKEIPHEIGNHSVELFVPPHWFLPAVPQPVKAIKITVSVRVTGIAYSIFGQATFNTLEHERSHNIQSGMVNAKWDTNLDKIEVLHLLNQSDVSDYIHKLPGILKVVRENMPLPRINIQSEVGRFYWPPSEDVVRELFARFNQSLPLGSPEEDFEGTNFARLFDDPFPGYNPIWKP